MQAASIKKVHLVSALALAVAAWPAWAFARETVVLPGVVTATGVLSGVDTQGPGLLTVGAQNINTANDAGGGITTNAANTASILFNNTSTITGFVGTTGSTFLNIVAGANGNTVTFTGPVFSTTFSLSGTGTVNFNGGFTSNTGSTMDFAGDGFITVGPGTTVLAAITNSAGANTGTLTLNANSILDGAVGAASGLKQINVVGGNALITGQVRAAAYTLNTNTLNVAGAFAIPVGGVINTTIFSEAIYGKIVPVGAASIGNALQINVSVTGPIANGTSFNIVDATSGTNGSTVVATENTTRYLFSAAPTANGLVRITVTQIPLASVVTPVPNPLAPVIAPVIDSLPIIPETLPLLIAITQLPTASAVADALAQLFPAMANLSAPQVSYHVARLFEDQWAARLEGIQGCGRDRERDDRKRVGVEVTSPCEDDDMRPHMRLTGFGYWGDQGNVDGFEGFESNIGGLMLAYEAPISETLRVGAGVGYARSSLGGKIYDNQSHINSYQATAYLGYAPGPWFLNAALAYELDYYSGSRHVVFPGFDSTAKADYNGHQLTALATTGYHFYSGDGRTIITPLATLRYIALHTDAYTERGGTAINLNIAAQKYNLVQSGLGAKVSRNIAHSDAQIIRPEIHVNWLHSLSDATMKNTAAFAAGGPAFSAVGLKPSRNLYEVGAGIAVANNKTWSVEGVYNYQWQNKGYSAHQAMINVVMHL